MEIESQFCVARMRPRRALPVGSRRPVLLCTLLAICATLALSSPSGRAQQTPQSSSALHHAYLSDVQDSFASLAEELEPTVVTILSARTMRIGLPESAPDGPRSQQNAPDRSRVHRSVGTGSGVIIRPEGWILTNDHVVGGADHVTVRLHDGREFNGEVRRDEKSDLALVKIQASGSLPAARLGDSDKVKVGYWAIAIGSPYRYEGSLSVGVISSLYRTQRILDIGAGSPLRFYPNMIQTDAAINPGNSGGPLCNIDGEVIGINTAIESENGGSVGIGFAIPINTAKFVVDQLISKGRVSYGYLGVKPVSITPRLASAMGVQYGALIELEPADDTPASRAGLHAGDVVTTIDNRPVKSEIELRTFVAQSSPNSTVALTVVRDGKQRTVKAVLTEAPKNEQDSPRQPAPGGKSRLGIHVEPLTDKIAEINQVPAKTPGVAVKAIDQDTAAADVEDLMEGCVILRVNGTDTPTVQAFQSATAGLKPGDLIKVLFRNRSDIHFVVIPIE
jgi:serine protease Do